MNQNIKQKNKHFSVPEGYFEYLPNKILSQINEIPASSEHKPIFYILKKQLPLAAAFLLFFAISYAVFRFISNSMHEKQVSLPVNTTYEEFILARMDEADLVDFLTNTSETFFTDPATVENYLIDENINEHIIQETLNQ